jgi:hypothetical protein
MPDPVFMATVPEICKAVQLKKDEVLLAPHSLRWHTRFVHQATVFKGFLLKAVKTADGSVIH